MAMSGSSSRIISIFNEALSIVSFQERQAQVERTCGTDRALRSRIEALLDAHDRAGRFLAGCSAAADAADEEAAQPCAALAGTCVGPYQLVEQIGEGGMGVVYLAEQHAPVKREVALKVIKPGMDTRQVIARFEAERQALALMDHPNIARVLDAGALPAGAPYFVMELVRGVPLTEFCDQNNLGVAERLGLFVQVCYAVQHAHQRGIIHRDIKPSNVLVTLHDGHGIPKIIDFGVAKAIGQQLTDKTLHTHFAQLIGSPLYMSPEQAALSGVDIDTRTDIYSLGVMLYELLTGTTPFKEHFRDASYDEIRRIIRDAEALRPSTHFGKLGSEGAVVAAHRKVTPERLRRVMRGDLDCIVMKSLEKDRQRRYETADRMAHDIQRYLTNQPIEARPQSASYQLRKFYRRHRVAISTVLLIAVALVAGTIVSTWQAIRATRAERFADAERSEAQEQRGRAEDNYQRARAAVDEYFTLVSENKLLDVPGLQPLRKDLLEAALRYYGDFAIERVNDPGTMADVAVTHLRVAEIYRTINQPNERLQAINRGLDVIERLRREYPRAHEQHRRLAGFWKGWRNIEAHMASTQDPQATMLSLERLMRAWRSLADENPATAAFQSDIAAINLQFDDVLGERGRHEEALEHAAAARSILQRLVEQFPAVPEYRADLAWAYESFLVHLPALGRDQETEVYFRQGLALREQLFQEFPDNVHYRANLVARLAQLGVRVADSDPREAETAFRRAIELVEPLWSQYPGTLLYQQRLSYSLNNLGKVLSKSGREGEAEQVRCRLIDVNRAWLAFRPDDWTVRSLLGHSYRKNAFYQLATNRSSQAEWNLRMAVEAFEKLVADHHDEQLHMHFLADTLSRLAELSLGQHKSSEATTEALRAIQVEPDDERAHKLLLDAMTATGDQEEALRILRENVVAFPRSAARPLLFGRRADPQGK